MEHQRLDLHHQYPWRRQEIITLAALALIPVAVAGLLMRGGAGRGTALGTLIPVTMLSGGLAAYALRLGLTRKRRSRIEGTLEGTTFTFTGGRFRHSRGDLAQHEMLGLRTNGPEQALVLSRHATDGGPDPEVVVPLRLVRQNAAGHDVLGAELRRITDSSELRVTPEAQRALQAHGL